MKTLTIVLVLSLFLASFVLAAQGQGAQVGTGNSQDDDNEAGNAAVTSGNSEESVISPGNQVENQVITNNEGEEVEIQVSDRIKLKAGNVEANTGLEIVQEKAQNRTKLKVHLSNGNDAEIKVMPNTASETALNRLRLKVCSADNNCSIELKEVGQGEQTKLAYELQAERHYKLLGLFNAKAQVRAQVDAENGEVISEGKPWWSFLAKETD